MATCSSCGAVVAPHHRFCSACGTPVLTGCPSCGADVEQGARFCSACGTDLGAPRSPAGELRAASAVRVAERRVCSVLFCDLVGFTPMSATRDPEEVRELLSHYFDTARTVIGRYGGTVEKFIGDAVMAVWGAPVAAETDAERAVRAALDVVAAVAALGGELGTPDLAARAGVVTGEVAVTLGATGQGMVAGDAVNTAARVQGAASPGGVLVDEATRRLAATAISFDDAGEHALKGKAEPERLWRATRVLSGVGGSQRVDGLEAPLIGRDAELRTVKELFHAAAERRVPRLVLVSGAAGVGKSRLGWEFEKYVDGLAARVLWHRGRCLSYGEGVAFWALAEIVRQRLAIAEEDPVETAAAKLSEGVARFVLDPEERTYVTSRLARLLGVPAGGGDGEALLAREELFAGWRLWVERLAADAPVILLIEDGQHADSGLLDFLDHLVDWARDLPIFVVVFARPELEQHRPGFGVGRNRTALTLDPLDGTSMDHLVDALVPGMPGPARGAITAHAQGIPLFAVETVRSLIDRRVVVSLDGTNRLVGDVGALAVPESLHGLLASRLDALEPQVRALVADAAVLGSTFPAEALVAVSGRSEVEVRAALAELLRREVLEVSADPLSPQRGTYGFAQSMLRQVAYETLSRRDRKARHLSVAEHLRATFPEDGEEIIDVVARHYLDAIEAVPDDPDVDELRAAAAAALVRAGERAERSSSSNRAAASYAAAAALVEPADATGAGNATAAAGLWERAALADILAAGYTVAIQRADRARRLYAAAGDVRAAARMQAVVGRALRRAGRHTEAREQLDEALAVLRPEPDADTVMAMNERATLEVFAGSADADRLSAEVLDLGQALDVDPGLLADLFVNRGIGQNLANRPAEGVASLEYAARMAERAGDSTRRARALLNLSDQLGRSDPAASLETAHAAAEHARRVGDREVLGVAVVNEATALLSLGRWDDANELVGQAAEADGLGDQAYVQCLLGWLQALRGAASRSADVEAGVAKLGASEDRQDQAFASTVEAFSADAAGQTGAALRQARKVLSHMEALGIGCDQLRWSWPLAARAAHELGDVDAERELVALVDARPPGHLPPLLRAERDLARARLLAAAGDGAATEAMVAAVAALRQVESPYHLADALVDLAAHLAGVDDQAGAAAALEEARAIGERLGAVALLRRSDRVAAPAPAGASA